MVVHEVLLYGPIVGGPDFALEFVLSADDLVLQVSMPGASVELLEPWS